MSKNWVTLQGDKFELLPQETYRFEYPRGKCMLSIHPIINGKEMTNEGFQCSGSMYITNKRLVLIGDTKNYKQGSGSSLQTFMLPLHSITDRRIKMPWFGANSVEGQFRVTPDGGLNPMYVWTFRVSYSEGGTLQFWEAFDRAMQDTSMEYDELPRYEE